MPDKGNLAVSAEKITKSYDIGDRTVTALKELSLEIEKGTFAAIVGKSGSGKSTLLKLLAGVEDPDSGVILLDGENYTALKKPERALLRRKKTGIVFQDFKLIGELNVRENILFPVLWDNRTPDEEYIRHIVTSLEIEELLSKGVTQLSGGESQRVAITRALAAKPQILFADEPTGWLDEATAFKTMSLLRDFNRKYKMTVLMVTHDKQLAQYADRILTISAGRLVTEEDGYEE